MRELWFPYTSPYLSPWFFLLHWLCLASKIEQGHHCSPYTVSTKWSEMITAQRNVSHTCAFPSFIFPPSLQASQPVLSLYSPYWLSSYFYDPYILGGASHCHVSPWQRLQWDVIGHFISSQGKQRQRWKKRMNGLRSGWWVNDSHW